MTGPAATPRLVVVERPDGLIRLVNAGGDEATRRGERSLCGEHLLLALVGDQFTEASAAHALRACGIGRPELERMLDALGEESDEDASVGLTWTYQLHETIGFARGLAAARGMAPTATDLLVAHVWDPWLAAHLAAHGLDRDALLDRLAEAGEPVPVAVPPPLPERAPWGPRIDVALEDMEAVLKLAPDLPAPGLTFNMTDEGAWFRVHEQVDAWALVERARRAREGGATAG